MLFPSATLLMALCAVVRASSGVSRRQSEVLTLGVSRDFTEVETSLGTVREECLTVLDEPGPRYCRVIVDDVPLDSGMSTASLGPSASEGGDELPSAISSDTSTTLVSAVGDGDGGPTSSQAGPTSLLTFQLSSIPASSTLSSLASSDPTTSSETATLPPESTSPESSPSSTSPSALEPVSSSSSTSPSALEPESSSSPSTSDVPSDSESSTVPTPSGVLTVTRSATGQPSFATGSASLLNPPSSSTSGVESGTTAEAAAADSTAQEIPGQKLQVLPIGLGVFGGLAGVTLAVVGYVMYERRKYRKQFRGRKLAEAGESPAGWVR